MNEKTLLQHAIEFAAAKHARQYRKGTTIPYMTHVVEAMEIVCRMTEDEELRAAAVLHDTLEDTKTTKDELVEYFGSRVADLVAAESEDKREGQPETETWMARKQETVNHLSRASTEVRMLALGDKLSNVRAMTRDYAVIGEELWQRFNQKNPVWQGMYYGLLANVFSEDPFLRETEAYREYVELCSGLFSKEYDGDGNLIEDEDEEEPDDDEEDGLPVRWFFADAMDEVRAAMPEGTKAWALILDRTEDKDLLQLQKMAATLDAFLRDEDTGFGDVHLLIVNEAGSDDVSWQRTEDGYSLHVCVENGRCWDQAAFQLGYLMMHCLIDHLGGKEDEGICWAEELICEAATLKLLELLADNWEKTPFFRDDPDYEDSIREYLEATLSEQGSSALLRCRDHAELYVINERNLYDDRVDESHDLYRAMRPEDLLVLAKVREYEADDLLIYTHYWRSLAEGSPAVAWLCRLQEKIPDCEIPAGIHQEVNLENSKPTDAQKETYGHMIRSLRALPCEYIIFSFLDSDPKDGQQIGLVFYQVMRRRDGRILTEIRLDTRERRKLYRINVDDDRAVGMLMRILETNEVPDLEDWEDFTEDVFPRADESEPEAAYDDDEYNDLNEWDIWENILHPDGRESDKED